MIDDLLTEIAESGWFLNNCYQVDASLWRVNLRRPDLATDGGYFTDWAEAPTFYEALAECMSKLHEAEYSPPPPTRSSIDSTPAPSLLSRLGLTRKPSTLERRI